MPPQRHRIVKTHIPQRTRSFRSTDAIFSNLRTAIFTTIFCYSVPRVTDGRREYVRDDAAHKLAKLRWELLRLAE
jgi:hypothetical protein